MAEEAIDNEGQGQEQEVDRSDMSVVEVSTSKTVKDEETGEKRKEEATTYLTVGDGLDDLVELYGAEIVFEYAIRQLKVRQQAQVRADLEAFLEGAEGAEAPESLTEKYKGWKPQIQRTKRKNPKEEALKAAEGLSPEELQELLAELSAKTAE